MTVIKVINGDINMSNIAILGHPTRGKEIIQLLEMLGGVNAFNLDGAMSNYYYYIDNVNGRIYHCLSINPQNCIIYTLEEFEEKFPYKVGNKVIIKKYKQIFEILSARWCIERNIIIYQTSNGYYYANELQPYKEENMEEEIVEPTTEINLNHPEYKGYNEIELILPDDWEFEQRGNKMFGIRKQSKYPKTYEECCKNVFGLVHEGMTVDLPMHYSPLLIAFTKLLICRNAYWKIAGEEMGLGKPWEPDWNNLSTSRAYIKINKGCFTYSSRVLVFPTEEMRDAFHENFKELINECKELL